MATQLFLDLDGVLITTPPWKSDPIAEDGYSEFNATCVAHLNTLLAQGDFELWISSSRRKALSLEALQGIFQRRGLLATIQGYLPIADQRLSRRLELERFIAQQGCTRFLVIDDDKSLNAFVPKAQLVQTTLLQGFNAEKLQEALDKWRTLPV